MNLRVLTRAIKIDQSQGIPESGIPEGAFVKKILQAFPCSRPYRHPSLFLSAHISARCPDDLNAWNRLMLFIGLPGTRSCPTNREGQERETKPQELAFVNLGLLIFFRSSVPAEPLWSREEQLLYKTSLNCGK